MTSTTASTRAQVVTKVCSARFTDDGSLPRATLANTRPMARRIMARKRSTPRRRSTRWLSSTARWPKSRSIGAGRGPRARSLAICHSSARSQSTRPARSTPSTMSMAHSGVHPKRMRLTERMSITPRRSLERKRSEMRDHFGESPRMFCGSRALAKSAMLRRRRLCTRRDTRDTRSVAQPQSAGRVRAKESATVCPWRSLRRRSTPPKAVKIWEPVKMTVPAKSTMAATSECASRSEPHLCESTARRSRSRSDAPPACSGPWTTGLGSDRMRAMARRYMVVCARSA
mmetsp:Transcript_2996/g.9843  ORF Transcript_2996/g.9843 Transcript_2996/m.9843 type:complete len:286 (-) Transcript_2996:1993-2850(-)